jgi:hypothetical protein
MKDRVVKRLVALGLVQSTKSGLVVSENVICAYMRKRDQRLQVVTADELHSKLISLGCDIEIIA